MTAPGDFVVGETLTAASMNEFGAWTSYTATLTNQEFADLFGYMAKWREESARHKQHKSNPCCRWAGR